MASAIESIPLKTITGADASLGDYAGKVRLVVNVASKCGLTPQYTALEKIYEDYKDKGFVVVGFPANDFGAQEPGTNEEIQQFCQTSYNVAFPLFAKISVSGEGKHPLYSELIAAQPQTTTKPGADMRQKLEGYGIKPNPAPEVLWNFEKFLVGKDGQVIGRFAPDIPPDDPLVTGAIEAELKK